MILRDKISSVSDIVYGQIRITMFSDQKSVEKTTKLQVSTNQYWVKLSKKGLNKSLGILNAQIRSTSESVVRTLKLLMRAHISTTLYISNSLHL